MQNKAAIQTSQPSSLQSRQMCTCGRSKCGNVQDGGYDGFVIRFKFYPEDLSDHDPEPVGNLPGDLGLALDKGLRPGLHLKRSDLILTHLSSANRMLDKIYILSIYINRQLVVIIHIINTIYHIL